MRGPTVRRPLRVPAPAGRRSILPSSSRLPAFAVGVLAFEAIAFALQLSRDVTPFVLVVIPPAAAGVASWACGGGREVRSLVGRLLIWRVRPRWYLAALGIPVAEKLVVDTAGVLGGATSPDRLLAAWSATALLVPIVVVVPAMLEEIGWRGFGVQAALDAGRSPTWAALVVGLIFMMLHVGLPVWPLPFILLSSSVLLTWIYLRTSSALLAGLMHAAFNASVPLTWGLDGAWTWKARAITLTVFAAALFISRQFHINRQQTSIAGAGS